VAFSSPVLTTLMLMDIKHTDCFPNLQARLRDVELTPDEPPKYISLPSVSNVSQSPILRLLRQSLAYCYNRFSRVTSAFSSFQPVYIISRRDQASNTEINGRSIGKSTLFGILPLPCLAARKGNPAD